MKIKTLVNKYVALGHSYRNAQNLAAEEIVLRKIASSPLSDSVTLKGGIVMYNLTKNDRRVTQDIDFDLIRYSIDEFSLVKFVEKMNSFNDGISASIEGEIEQLHQENYQGARILLSLTDEENSKLIIKLDVGVHTYSAIEQEKIIFVFTDSDESISIKVNSCEQIVCEKLISLARLGPLSTRYKDIYDIYYLIKNKLVDSKKVVNILKLFLESQKRGPSNIDELINDIVDTLNNREYAEEAKSPASKWIDVDYDSIVKEIIDFLYIL